MRIYKHYDLGGPGFGRLSFSSYPGETFSDGAGGALQQLSCALTLALRAPPWPREHVPCV